MRTPCFKAPRHASEKEQYKVQLVSRKPTSMVNTPTRHFHQESTNNRDKRTNQCNCWSTEPITAHSDKSPSGSSYVVFIANDLAEDQTQDHFRRVSQVQKRSSEHITETLDHRLVWSCWQPKSAETTLSSSALHSGAASSTARASSKQRSRDRQCTEDLCHIQHMRCRNNFFAIGTALTSCGTNSTCVKTATQ